MHTSIPKLLAASAQAQGAATDMIEAAREGEIRAFGNVYAGDTLTCAADSLRLLIEAMYDAECPDATETGTTQLHGALIKFLQDRE